MKPLIHAKSSARKYGGIPEDYLPIHDFMDSSKAALADVRHRAILHSSFGIYIVEKVFGTYFKNSDGKDVSTRDIAEQHVLEDLHHIPTLDKWFKGMPIEDWMMGKREPSKKTVHKFDKSDQHDFDPNRTTSIEQQPDHTFKIVPRYID